MNKFVTCLLIAIALLLPATAYAKQPAGWTKATTAKYNYLQRMGYTPEYAETIINECKAIDGKPGFNKNTGRYDSEWIIHADNCIAWTSSVCKQESSAGQDKRTNAICGMVNQGKNDYVTQIKNFIKAYRKYRYKHQTVEGWIYQSKFCVTEPD